jgi:Spy/CpxP family protein refolding chaperone
MTTNKMQLFNIVIAALLIGAPAMAADSGAGTPPGVDGKMTASKNLGGGGGACQKGGHCGGGARMNLSDAQLEKMGSLKNKYADSTSAEKAQLGTLFRQMKDVISKPEIDRAQAVALQSKINAVKDDLSTARLNLKLDEIAVLTPDQREQIHHRMLEREAFGGGQRHHGHFGRGGHEGHGGHGGHSGSGPRQDKA